MLMEELASNLSWSQLPMITSRLRYPLPSWLLASILPFMDLTLLAHTLNCHLHMLCYLIVMNFTLQLYPNLDLSQHSFEPLTCQDFQS
jgi:hypothetical protein